MLRISTIIAPAIVALGCFGGLLIGRRTFLFRDSSHYYFPLWHWITSHWQRGEFPLWNPYENAGAPLAADATASLFYPGKLLFLLPLPFDIAYNLFLLAHFALAFWLTWRAARQFGVTLSGATLAALAYTFSGSVLIQHANAPYLIGAAWLPLALSACYGLMREPSRRHATGLAVALAMIVLGGDVQSAYHMLLVMVLAWWLIPAKAADLQPKSIPWYRRRAVLVLGSCALAGGLAAVQILPARDWTSHTVRATSDQPRNIYEAGSLLVREDSAGEPSHKLTSAANSLLGTPPRGSHQEASYAFSVGPWRWPELLWPNVSGRMYPVNRRWLSVIPAEGRVWAPSLYLGILPLLLAFSVTRMRRGRPLWRWLSWLALLSVLAALGWHGLGWIVHEIDYAWRGSVEGGPSLGPQVGGLYWFFSTVLPGYAYFRYPAKWFTFASLAISLLAGHGLQVNLRHAMKRTGRLFAASAGLSVVALVALLIFRRRWLAWVNQAAVDQYFGPLDASGAWLDCLLAILHSLILIGLCIGLYRYRQRFAANRLACLLVLLTAVDLAIAQSWLTPTAAVRHWQAESALAVHLRAEPKADSPRIHRSRSPGLLPPQWSRQSSPERMIEGLHWERDTLHPKHYLAAGIGSIHVSTAMVSYDHAAWLAVAQERAHEQRSLAVYQELSVSHLVVPVEVAGGSRGRAEGRGERGGKHGVLLPGYDQVAIVESENALPRVRLTRRVTLLPELTSRSASAITERTREVMRLTDDRRTVVLESASSELEALVQALPARSIGSAEQAHVVRETPNRIELAVRLNDPAVLILADTFTSDWRATLIRSASEESLPVYRANRLFRGMILPAGEYRLRLSYQPRSFVWGAYVSLVSWFVLIIGAGSIVARRRLVRLSIFN